MQEEVILALGSNLGNSLSYLKEAQIHLQKLALDIPKSSKIYKSEPIGPPLQRDYLNQCMYFKTNLSPQDLLTSCQEIEQKMGRKERPKWHSREIDIDILTYGNKIIHTPNLTVPHPEIFQRPFVIFPLSDLLPNLSIPLLSRTKTVQEQKNDFLKENKFKIQILGLEYVTC